jgi:hypothetical protein
MSARGEGKEIGAWLRAEEAVLGGFRVTLPSVPDSIQWEAKASRSPSAFEPLPWPHRTYGVAWNPLKDPPGSGTLVGPEAPSFVQFAYAAGNFFGLPGALGGTGGQGQLFRLQDRSGRISSVRVGPTDVEVALEGERLPGSVIELASERPGSSILLGNEGHEVVRFPLPEGLPRGAWMVLKREGRWLDRKFLNWPNAADPGVEHEVEDRDRLATLIAAGEGPNIEFKRELPRTRGERNFLRTVAAFANGEGGSILFGVADDGEVVGIEGGDVGRQTRDTITDLVRSQVTPLPPFKVETYPIDAKQDRLIVVLAIGQGPLPPYGFDPAKPVYYVRRGATTFPASSDQIRALARSRPPADQSLGNQYWLPGQ